MSDTNLQIPTAPPAADFFADKAELRRILDEQNALMGFVPVPEATREGVRDRMRALGIRAQDNVFSCGIIAARGED